jgi:hypothetical protein
MTSKASAAQDPQEVSRPTMESVQADAAAISQNTPTDFLDVSTEVPRGQPRSNVFSGPSGPERIAFWADKKYAHRRLSERHRTDVLTCRAEYSSMPLIYEPGMAFGAGSTPSAMTIRQVSSDGTSTQNSTGLLSSFLATKRA